MKETLTRSMGLAAFAVAAALLAMPSSTQAANEPPQVSKDGLQLQKHTRTRLVYVKPGATFDQYKRVAILECDVELKENWQRDFNEDRMGVKGRVSDEDVARIKANLAAEFKKVFTDELHDKGGYDVADVVATDVLLLRPALINVDVYAPDLGVNSIGPTMVRSAGEMTLYLELWDPATKTILARIEDAKDDDEHVARLANTVTNKAAADHMLREWAEELRKRLDMVSGKNQP